MPTVAWMLTCVAVLVAGLFVRLSPVELTVAWPTFGAWPQATSMTGLVALVLATMAVLMLILSAGQAREGSRGRPFAELLLFFPVLFAFVWLLLPAGRPDSRSLVVAAGILLMAGYLLRHSPGPFSRPLWRRTKLTLALDSGLILLPVLLGLSLGQSPDWKASAISIFLYPLYALIQLGVFLVIPTTRLRALGVSAKSRAVFTALLFALIHWPNPLVMLMTLAGQLLWAHQYQRGRQLWQLALVMGLTATTVSQFLPDQVTHHMRVGPGYVRSEAIATLADQSSDLQLSEYLEIVYPQILGRNPGEEERKVWGNLVEEARLRTWAFMFLSSTEKRDKMRQAGQEQPPSDPTHWSDWPEPWKDRIEVFVTPQYREKTGGELAGYLQGLYRDILGREASPKELQSWKTQLTSNQKRRIAEVLLDWRFVRGQDLFTGMAMEEFRFPN